MNSTKHITIKQAQQRVKKFLDVQGKDWTQIDNHFFLFTHMNEEMGELARHTITAEGSGLDLGLERNKWLSLIKEAVRQEKAKSGES